MGEFKTWNELEKELEFTKEEDIEMKLEKQIIEAAIMARKNSKLTQAELSKKSGIKQPNIAKLEKHIRSPQLYTILKILFSMGYTLKVVPLNNKHLQNLK